MRFLVPPPHELSRSPAAAFIGAAAERAGILCANFEHRVALPLPAEWCPEGRGDLGAPPTWSAGQLPESKYQSYRHDLLAASYHPGHRAKWTTHELCHGLIGYCWRPDATPLFHALASWAAEILPVALWYFFDEAQLRRCPLHTGGGPLFGTFCEACEAAAQRGPTDTTAADTSWWADGQRFVTDQLDAVRASAAAGRVLPRRYATLDLASDGLAYAAAHGARLNSSAFQTFAELFPPPADNLELFLETIQSLTSSLVSQSANDIGPATRWQTAAQDIAWRLLTVRSECDGEAADALLEICESLAGKEVAETEIERAIHTYQQLGEDWYLPEASEVFAVGYPLPCGFGTSEAQIEAGLRSAVPATLTHLPADALRQFCGTDTLQRRPLAHRFADWLSEDPGCPPGVADLARFEAYIAAPPAADLEALTLVPSASDQPLTRGQGIAILSSRFDLPSASEGAPLTAGAQNHWLFARNAEGDLALHEVSEAAAMALESLRNNAARPAEDLDITPEERIGLVSLGALQPIRYALVLL
jgi:hypothetical protein